MKRAGVDSGRPIVESMSARGISLAATLFVTICVVAPADEALAERGRLPDGRAYRTDEGGYRLIDHVAELELQIEDLQKQVNALENEVGQKQTKIASLEKGRCSAQLQEATLVGAPVTPTQVETVKVETKVVEVKTVDPRATEERDAALQQVALLEKKLSQQEEMLATKAKLIEERDDALEKQAEELERQGDELARQRESQEELLAKLEEKPAPTVVALRDSGDAGERARLKSVPPVSESRGEGVNTAPLKTTLREIDQLIVARKNLIDALKSSKLGVSIPVQPLVARSGLSLDTIRLRLAQLQPSEVTPVQVGLSDIKAVLEEDIRVMQRLKGL